jgi:predicted glycogen debranching enzyme
LYIYLKLGDIFPDLTGKRKVNTKMMKLLDDDICQSVEQITEKEWLEVNKLGSYSSSTLCGLNSRRFHGLFVVPCNGNGKRANILSKIEESVFIENRVYEISTNKFIGGVYPKGYKYLKKIILDPFPKFYYEIEDRKIEKITFLLQEKNILVIRYILKNQGKPVKLILKPMIAGRYTHDLTKDVQGMNTDSYPAEHVVKITPRPDIPELKIYYNKGDYVPATLWYYSYLYAKDTMEDQKNIEDLFNPGFFTYVLQPYESFDLLISLDEVAEYDYESIYRQEVVLRQKKIESSGEIPKFINTLIKNICVWFVPAQNAHASYLPNYHQATSSLRETLLSYFGLLYIPEFQPQIRDEIARLDSLLSDGLLPVSFPTLITGTSYQTSDCSLLFINLMYLYFKITNDRTQLEAFFNTTRKILESYQEGTRYNIYQDKDGLLVTGNTKYSTSWMPLINREGQVIRHGKICEINALWYNALKIMEFFSRSIEKNRFAGKFAKYSARTRNSFIKKFWNSEHESLYDVIQDNHKDESLRAGQIIPLALPFNVLDMEKGQMLLQKIENELFTPYGLRTLSKMDDNYIGKIDHSIDRAHPAYYTGAVWPWTIGLYVDAVLNYRGVNVQVVKTLLHFLNSFKKKMVETAIGYISELFEGDEPYRANGNVAYALNSTEIIRAYLLLNQIKLT